MEAPKSPSHTLKVGCSSSHPTQKDSIVLARFHMLTISSTWSASMKSHIAARKRTILNFSSLTLQRLARRGRKASGLRSHPWKGSQTAHQKAASALRASQTLGTSPRIGLQMARKILGSSATQTLQQTDLPPKESFLCLLAATRSKRGKVETEGTD